MAMDPWLPHGHKLPDGAASLTALFEGSGWQILSTQAGGRALLAEEDLASKWIASGLIGDGHMQPFNLGSRRLWAMSCGPDHVVSPVFEGRSPDTKAEALAFSLAMKATREIDPIAPLQDAIYIERFSRLLPTYSISPRADDEVVLGYWLTGGATIPATSFRRLSQTMSWLGAHHLKDVVEAAGFTVPEIVLPGRSAHRTEAAESSEQENSKAQEPAREPATGIAPEDKQALFELAGRPELAAFFNEHVVDIVLHRERYAALGIGFPAAIVLHGPPGCGKTFAVERLVDFLGWPSFQVEASSVASPYIHETSKKVAAIFDKAMESAPSVLVIDEMEAFLADREMGSGHHRVEEVAEFLRRIPEAVKREVLIIGMTNRVEMIDPAILRRGRFDHVIKVDYASEEEVLALIHKLLSTIPMDAGVDPLPIALALAGRPLSDVSFVIREGARLAARAGKEKINQESLLQALKTAPAREREGGQSNRIGFL